MTAGLDRLRIHPSPPHVCDQRWQISHRRPPPAAGFMMIRMVLGLRTARPRLRDGQRSTKSCTRGKQWTVDAGLKPLPPACAIERLLDLR